MTKLARLGVLTAAVLWAVVAYASDSSCNPWPEWQRFKQLYISDDGRVVDAQTQNSTVSEGQAYALMFALIANDEAAFSKTLQWTRDNLAAGDLEHTLPAWKWGQAQDGSWKALDQNSASDADLWMLYALEEAARLWHNPSYAHTAHAMADLILQEEIAFVPGLGPTLLPAPKGFVTQETWRLNASYSPLQIFRAIGSQTHNRLWDEVLKSSSEVIIGSAPHGYAADWINYRPAQRFITDSQTRGMGSYNAIRVYLWAGMLSSNDSQTKKLLRQFEPVATRVAQQSIPESIDTQTLESHGEASAGFSAAMLPLLTHFKFVAAVQSYRQRIKTEVLKDNQHYYSDVLALFGLGWLDGYYRFDPHGYLHVEWTASCHATH